MLRSITGRSDSGVRFHDDGRLESCTLDRAAVIDGESLAKGARVTLDSAGRLLRPGPGP
ncbi:MAG: hypothetical protein GY716_22845 [bacterium]|nr:hypothetical protein [bacterium]